MLDTRLRYRPIAARHEPVAPRESARPERSPAEPDEVVDVVVVGSGCGGLATALFCAWRGLDVLILEKAPEIGGTTRKSAFWTWVPNNPHLAQMGVVDDLDDFLRYCLRTARPEKYNPAAPFLGAAEGDYRLVEAIYESTWPAVQELHDRGGLRFRPAPHFLDYLAHLEEDRAPYGRVMVPEGSNEEMTNGGLVAVESLSAACLAEGVRIRVGQRVQRLLVSDDHRISGVMASAASGQQVRVVARHGVVFATGGFTHDPELVEHFLAFPSLGGCAARTNEGDFVRIAPTVGAQLRNMQHAWRSAVALERVAAEDPHMNATTSWPGDSMIGVTLEGRRCLNEKLPYNELAAEMGAWDSRNARYPNLFMIQLWDQRAQDLCQAESNGSIIPTGFHDHVFSADTLEGWADIARQRLERLTHLTGGARLSDTFMVNLHATIARWNLMSRSGVDTDFGRGAVAPDIEGFGGPIPEEAGRVNPVMWPLAADGPYYGAIVAAGTLDTKGGPKVDVDGRVLDDLDTPIAGLFGVGNCVGAVQARSYWAGGATLGPMIGFARRIADHLAHDSSAVAPLIIAKVPTALRGDGRD